MTAPTKDPLDYIEEFRQAHRAADAELAVRLTAEEMASLLTLISNSIPGAEELLDTLIQIDREAITGDIIDACYSLGYMRALEDLRQERVSV